jgi:hypothetical protein
MSKGKPLIGTVKLPYQHVEKMKEKVAARRNRAATSLAPVPEIVNRKS